MPAGHFQLDGSGFEELCTIESGTQNVHQAFDKALNDSLCMQDGIYKKMASKGWYPTQQAEQQKINEVRQKFAGQNWR